MTDVHPYLDWPGPIPFAHRGGTSEAPENTMPAFEHAVSLGFHHLETDVHLSADGVLMAFHDCDLSRTCGVNGTIADMTAEELAGVRVDGRAAIPLMGELFDAFPDVRFLTVAEVATIMRVSKMTVYRLVHSGDLPAIRFGRSFRVPESAVVAAIATPVSDVG